MGTIDNGHNSQSIYQPMLYIYLMADGKEHKTTAHISANTRIGSLLVVIANIRVQKKPSNYLKYFTGSKLPMHEGLENLEIHPQGSMFVSVHITGIQ